MEHVYAAVDTRLQFASASCNESTAGQASPVTSTSELYIIRLSDTIAHRRHSNYTSACSVGTAATLAIDNTTGRGQVNQNRVTLL